jgi:hypothetical protein
MLLTCHTQEFTCLLNNVTDLCFNGGECLSQEEFPTSATTLSFYCECPPGWGAENAPFHYPNCAQPDNLYLGMLIVDLIQVAIYLPWLFVISQRKTGPVRALC